MQPTGQPVARNNEDYTDEFCTHTLTHGGNRRHRMVKSPCNCRREKKEVAERTSAHLLPRPFPTRTARQRQSLTQNGYFTAFMQKCTRPLPAQRWGSKGPANWSLHAMVVVVCRCVVFAVPFARARLPNRRKRRRRRPLRPHRAHLQKNSAAQCVEVNQRLLGLQDKAHKGEDSRRWARCGLQRGGWVRQSCWCSLRAWFSCASFFPSRWCSMAPGLQEP